MLLPSPRLPITGPEAAPTCLVSPVLERLPRVLHGFTMRHAGSVEPPRGGRPAEGVDALSQVLGVEGAGFRRCEVVQVHGASAWTTSGPHAPPAAGADALVSSRAGDLLVVRTADCLAVLMVAVGGLDDAAATSGTRAVAAAHAGWRGLVDGVLEATVAALQAAAPGARLVAALGPAIGPCCFEVGPEVAERFVASFGESVIRPGAGDRSFADLPGAARLALGRAGVAVPDPQSPPCTRCSPDLFHSYRAEGAAAGRMAAFIALRPW